MELKIISASMMDRGCFNLVEKYIEDKDLTPEGLKILGAIKEFYTRDPNAKSCDRELVEKTVIMSLPEHQDKHRMLFKEILKKIPKEVSVENLSNHIIAVKRERVAHELNQALLTKRPERELEALMEKWSELKSLDSLDNNDSREVYTGWNVEDLVKHHFDPKGLIKIAPKSLNDRVDGGAKPGHHVLIFAPTEVGKSLFAINMVAAFCKQGLRTLYIENEEPIADTDMRVINRMTLMTKHEVRENPAKASGLLKESGYENFTIAGLSPGTFSQIYGIVQDIDPHVIVFNQLGNLDMRVDGPTHTLLAAAKSARALAKSKGMLAVSVAQASDDAYGRLHLRSNDVQWSNVDLPGHMDLIIGIGVNEQMEAMGTRRISLPKNKMSGDHSWFDVLFIKEYSKVEELGQT